MGIKVIVNIESVMPLYEITSTGVDLIPNVETPKLEDFPEKETVSRTTVEGFSEGSVEEITLELKQRDPILRDQAVRCVFR